MVDYHLNSDKFPPDIFINFVFTDRDECFVLKLEILKNRLNSQRGS